MEEKKGIKLEKLKEFIVKNKKPLLIALIVVLVLIVLLTIYFGFAKKNETSINTGEKVTAITAEGIVKEETLEGLKFSNVVLIKKDKMYTMTIDVNNPTNQEVSVNSVNITLKDKNGTELITLLGYIGDPLKAGETRTITSVTSVDLSKAVTKEISVKQAS